MVNPSCPLLAHYICKHAYPSSFYYDLVYQLNSRLKSFNRKVLLAARASKDAIFSKEEHTNHPEGAAEHSRVRIEEKKSTPTTHH